MRAIALILMLTMVLLSTAAQADVPGLINYQGTLTDDLGIALDTTVAMTFSIHTDSVGGAQVWTETQPTVGVSSGIFNVLLGRVNPIPVNVFAGPSRWLGVQVGDDPDLGPRQRIAATGYSFWAAEADTAEYARSVPSFTDGDWKITGTDMYSAVPGSVGIGTMSPGARLEVNGTLLVTDKANIGPSNNNSGLNAFVAGESNTADGDHSTVGGGSDCVASGLYGAVGGGEGNVADNIHSAVGGGEYNSATGVGSAIGGGSMNQASGRCASVTGGLYNTAGGDYSFAAGRRAKANHPGTFVWADSTNADFASTGENQFLIRASGGVGIGTTSPGAQLDVQATGDSAVAGVFTIGNASNPYSTLYANTIGSGSGLRAVTVGSGDAVYGLSGGSGRAGYFRINNASNDGSALYAVTNGTGEGISGENSAANNFGYMGGANYGIYGEHSTSGNYGYLGSENYGVYGHADSGYAVVGGSDSSYGVYGGSIGSHGVHGVSANSYGVYGSNASSGNYGYLGSSDRGVVGVDSSDNYGYLASSSHGVFGLAYDGTGVYGGSNSGNGVHGEGVNYGVYGSGIVAGVYGKLPMENNYGFLGHDSCGVFGHSVSSDFGVYGENSGGNYGYLGGSNYSVHGRNASSGNYGYLASNSFGVRGYHQTSGNQGYIGGDSVGVYGFSSSDYGIRGTSNSGYGVYGYNYNTGHHGFLGSSYVGVFGKDTLSGNWGGIGNTNWGIIGSSPDDYGVQGQSTYGTGMVGFNSNTFNTGYIGTPTYAGDFSGDVHITGSLSKGSGSFLIDHPLDPENKLLRHNFVESPENLLIYRGKAQLDGSGEAMVEMPDYFPVLTKEDEATVNLTPIGRSQAPGRHEFSYEWESHYGGFHIFGEPNREVAWMVMADRDDPVIRQLAQPVEEEKSPGNKLCDRGELLYPVAYGYPESMGRDYKEREKMKLRERELARERGGSEGPEK